MNLSKYWPYYVYIIIVPLLYNRISLSGALLSSSIFTFYFFMLYTLTLLYMALSARFVSHLVAWYNQYFKARGKLFGLLYYVIGLLLAFAVLALFTAVWYYKEDRFWDIMWAHTQWRFSLYLLATIALTAWLVRFPDYAWYKHKVQEVKCPEPIVVNEVQLSKPVLFTFYDHLHASMLELVFNDAGEVRFPGIICIQKFSKRAVVYFIDGSSYECNDIMERLKDLGLDQWLVKLSKNYHINMMHAYYPDPYKGNLLELQPKTVAYMLENGHQMVDLTNICTLGARIGKSNVDAFMKNRADLNLEVWDDFVMINRKK